MSIEERGMIRGGLGVASAMVLVGWLAGCATQGLPPVPEPAPDPLPVAGLALRPLALDGVGIAVPAGRVLGYEHEGPRWRRGHDYRWGRVLQEDVPLLERRVLNLLRAAGYAVVPADSLGAGVTGTRVLLHPVLIRVSFDTYSHGEGFQQAGCEVRWDVYRSRQDKPFASWVTRGAARQPLGSGGALVAALDVATGALLANNSFSATLER